MTTLNARANQAYQALIAELATEDQVLEFSTSQGAFEEGWETGYKTARAEFTEALAKEYAADPEPSRRFSPSIWEEWAERHRTRNRRVEDALNLIGGSES